VFERFDEPAKRALAYAQEESRQLRAKEIAPEHLILGLLHDPGPAGQALRQGGLELDTARQQFKPGSRWARGGSGHLPFTPEAKRSLMQAKATADASCRTQSGPPQIGPPQLLTEVLKDPAGGAVLRGLGADPEQIADELSRLTASIG
jgi:ATP-dependent Clp protease ATP-binding subunit ClpA